MENIKKISAAVSLRKVRIMNNFAKPTMVSKSKLHTTHELKVLTLTDLKSVITLSREIRDVQE